MSTGAHAIDVETAWVIQAAFWSAILFMAVYSGLYHWWRTILGRVLGTVAIAIAAYNLPAVLIYGHALRPDHGQIISNYIQPSNWTWFAEQFRAVLPVSFLVLTWLLIRLSRQPRLGQNVRPPGDVHRVNGGAHR